jgi:hypothetical protein
MPTRSDERLLLLYITSCYIRYEVDRVCMLCIVGGHWHAYFVSLRTLPDSQRAGVRRPANQPVL